MGNIVPTGRAGEHPRQLLEAYDGAKYVFQEMLWDGKFLKSILCQHAGNLVVVKVYEKVPGSERNKSLSLIRRQLEEIRNAIQPRIHPNLIPYNRFGETSQAAFLVRQYLNSSLHDRQSMRPFLSPMEKCWIAFQLLKALSQCHNANIVHGDIKSNNILVTSWNWALLADFAPYKPTFLPIDDTAPFSYFFQSNSMRDCCCVAPERFCSPTSIIDISLLDSAPPQCSSFLSVMMDNNVPALDADHELGVSANDFAQQETQSTPVAASPRSSYRQRNYSFSSHNRSARLRPSMDIFSLGCVLMELFLDGEPCFTLAELLKYAKRDGDDKTYLESKLQKLKNPRVAALARHMLGNDPVKRASADTYLEEYTGPGKLFPTYFNDFLHSFMADMLSSDFDVPDERIWVICKNYKTILQQVCQIEDPRGTEYFEARFQEWVNRMTPVSNAEDDDQHGEWPIRTEPGVAQDDEPSEVVEDLLLRTQKILDEMSKLKNSGQVDDLIHKANKSVKSQLSTIRKYSGKNATTDNNTGQGARIFGMEKDDFLEEYENENENGSKQDHYENGTILIISMICSTMRFVRFPTTKVIALRLLQRFSRFSDDETRLQRVVPFVVGSLSDTASSVRCTALGVLSSVLSSIRQIPASDRRFFPEYLFPALNRFKLDPSLTARLKFAESLPRLAETSAYFLELSRLEDIRAGGVINKEAAKSTTRKVEATKVNFDGEMDELHGIVQDFVSNMVEQPAVVRRTLLCDITRLCLFFGRERTSGHILPILITFLNERNDWQLRATFFEHIPGVSALVGPLALQQFLLPCIIQALQDVEELVIERTLNCLFALVELGLLDSTVTTELTAKVVPLVYHPGVWIRHAVVRLLAALVSSERLGAVEIQVTIVRLLLPVFKEDMKSYAVLIGYNKSIEENEQLLREMIREPVQRNLYDAALARLENENASTAPSTSTRSSKNRKSSGNANSWLKLSRPNAQSTQKKEQATERKVDEKDDTAAEKIDFDTLGTDDKSKLKAMEPYLRSSVGARRGDRSKPSDAPSELPEEYTKQIAKRAQLYSVVVPDQRYVTLAIHNKYSEYIDFTASSIAPGSFLLHRNPEFKDLVNRFGVISRSRRHGGAHGPMTSEALSAGETRLLHRIRALEVPPLPPNMGALRKLDGSYIVANVRRSSAALGSISEKDDGSMALPTTKDAATTPTEKPWRPRGVLAANLYGHDSAVNRICTSQDSLFFATGSDDGTVKLWLTAGLEDGYGIRCKLTYASQGGCITDLCMIENTHSIASVSTTGSVHVFKVEHALDATRQTIDPNDTNLPSSSTIGERDSDDEDQGDQQHGTRKDDSRTAGSQRNLAASTVFEVDLQEDGAIRAICHFPTVTESLLAFASESGTIHGWDLRCKGKAWNLKMGPQAGFVTSVVVPPEGDALWLVAGTSRGVIVLWDIRFHIILKAWRHSSHSRINRLYISSATCSDPFVYVGAGENEFSLYNIATGSLIQTYKTVATDISCEQATKSATLEPLDISQLEPSFGEHTSRGLGLSRFQGSLWDKLGTDELKPSKSRAEPSVRAILCPFDTVAFESSRNLTHKSHIPLSVISAGTDRRIRYWDVELSNCYSIWDQEYGVYTKQYWDSFPNVMVCREDLLEHKNPQPSNEGRGLAHPSSNHEDAILDISYVNSDSTFQTGTPKNNPGFLLTASRDGVVKAWV
mmetsp:Transcript_40990/g.65928  ORF Transcript_40990/g.65928 Transcript_40990/m.65928 type:complete len:1696 (+) Transcript_40990:140-5227(+)